MKDGKIITFYSFTNGVGRTACIANVAYLLANKYNKKVLVIDFDFQTPSLNYYFKIKNYNKSFTDLFLNYKNMLNGDDIEDDNLDIELNKIVDANQYSINIGTHQMLEFIPAKYNNDFDWENFYKNWHGYGFIEYFKENIRKHYDYILINSETRSSDISGICVLQFADMVILPFVYNNQTFDGLSTVIKSICEKSSNKVYMIPSKTVSDQFRYHVMWRNRFKSFDKYITNFSIPYSEYFSYGEKLVAFDEGCESLLEAYNNIVNLILNDTEE